jgi:outer membrane protein
MNKLIITLASLLFSLTLPAQKFGYVDTKYILNHVPDYAAAQQQINKLSSDWQQEIEDKYSAVEKMEKAYQAEKILLTDEMRQKREADIEAKRQEAKEMQKSKFGVEGELFKTREELIKPIQDQIYEAIKDISSQSGLMVVFDKANHSNMLYTNPKHDISDKVIKKMGFTPGETTGDEKEGGEEEDKEEEDGEKPGSNVPAKGRDGEKSTEGPRK